MSEPPVSAPLEAAEEALEFRCTGCGECCRRHRAAVTSFDVARLIAATGRAAEELVAWLAPDEVDMTGEPESFVELSEGRRLLVLARTSGACSLLGADNLCSVYAARPLDCRSFPFDFELVQRNGLSVRRLKLLPLKDCDYARDGQQDLAQIAAEDATRWHELTRYQSLVAHWNRLAHHRRRLHHRLGTRSDFLAFALSRREQP
ncbi:MAG TPA: YkgJ family cysteine cluster protein [Polyangiaceae bacterium]|nr:YkgJ family cysteine cluster protein [Polyangiaceae bacterium]